MDLKLLNADPTTEERAAIDTAIVSLSSVGADGVFAKRHLLLPGLEAAQGRVGWISEGAFNYIGETLQVPPAEAYGVMTFYALLTAAPRAPRVVHVCEDIACKARGSDALINELKRSAGPPAHYVPAADHVLVGDDDVAWLPSPCLGLCDQAPAAFVQIAGEHPIEELFGDVTIDRLRAANENVEATWGSAAGAVATAGPTRLLHRHNVEYFSAAFHRLLLDPRLTDIAADLIGSPNVQLHHSKLFIKPPEKGSPFPMHQDVPYFPHDRHSMIAAIVHFDDAPEEKGCLRVVPGSHQGGPLPHDEAGGWHLPFEQYPLTSSVVLPARAGDVLFFSYLTIHGSGVNVSQEARTTLLVQMRDPADRPSRRSWEAGQGLMLRGVLPAGAEPALK